MKKYVFLGFMLIMIMSLKSTVAVSADEGDKKTYIANFVFAEDINKNGTNLTSSSADGSFRDISQKSFCLTSNGNGEVQIELALEAEKVVVTGNAIAKTENGDTVFFKGQSTNKDYSVVAVFVGDEETYTLTWDFKGATDMARESNLRNSSFHLFCDRHVSLLQEFFMDGSVFVHECFITRKASQDIHVVVVFQMTEIAVATLKSLL